MKNIIEPAIPEKVQYICDLCGKEIEQNIYGTSVVEIVAHDVGGNGWNEWTEINVYHSHRSCIKTAIDLMGKNNERTNC